MPTAAATTTTAPITVREFLAGVQDRLESFFEIPAMDSPFRETVDCPEGFTATFAISKLDRARVLRHRHLPHGKIVGDCMGRRAVRCHGWVAEVSARGWIVGRV